MASESLNAAGQTVVTLEPDEAAVVVGPDSCSLYLHQCEHGVVDDEINRVAAAMAQMYYEFANAENPFDEEVPSGAQDPNQAN